MQKGHTKSRRPAKGAGKGLLCLLLACALTFPALPVMATPADAETPTQSTAEPSEEEQRRQQEIEALKAQQQQMESQISGAQSELRATESHLSSLQGNIAALQGEQADLLAEMDTVSQDIFERMARIDAMEEDLGDLEVQYEIKQEEYDEAKGQEAVQYEAMKNRVRFMYEKGDIGYMELIMKASTFGEMLNKTEYVEKLYEYDRNMLQQFQKTQEMIAEKQAELSAQMKAIEKAREQLQNEKKELEERLDALETEVEDYEERIADARSLANALRVEASAQERELANLVAQKNAVAAQEQQLRAAQAAAQQAAAGTAGIATITGGTAPAAPVQTTPKPVATGGSAAGRNVVNYACQFVGNPYVYGGSSLTGGTDCSGFTMAVYAHFGVSLPHQSEAQMAYGTAIASLDQAVAGDLLFYGGHVGIYCGDGTIVHASTRATGIKYSAATYRPIIGIRRLVN